MTLPALAAERRRREAAAIDGYLLQAPRPAAASRTFMLYAVDRRDRQTDRQTEDGHLSVIYTLYSTHCGVGVNNHVVKNVFHAQRSSSSKSFNLSEKHQISSKSLTMHCRHESWTYRYQLTAALN